MQHQDQLQNQLYLSHFSTILHDPKIKFTQKNARNMMEQESNIEKQRSKHAKCKNQKCIKYAHAIEFLNASKIKPKRLHECVSGNTISIFHSYIKHD